MTAVIFSIYVKIYTLKWEKEKKFSFFFFFLVPFYIKQKFERTWTISSHIAFHFITFPFYHIFFQNLRIFSFIFSLISYFIFCSALFIHHFRFVLEKNENWWIKKKNLIQLDWLSNISAVYKLIFVELLTSMHHFLLLTLNVVFDSLWWMK